MASTIKPRSRQDTPSESRSYGLSGMLPWEVDELSKHYASEDALSQNDGEIYREETFISDITPTMDFSSRTTNDSGQLTNSTALELQSCPSVADSHFLQGSDISTASRADHTSGTMNGLMRKTLIAKEHRIQEMVEVSGLDELISSVDSDLWLRRSRKRPLPVFQQRNQLASHVKSVQQYQHQQTGLKLTPLNDKFSSSLKEVVVEAEQYLYKEKDKDVEVSPDTRLTINDNKTDVNANVEKSIPSLQTKRLVHHVPPGYQMSQEALLQAKSNGLVLFSKSNEHTVPTSTAEVALVEKPEEPSIEQSIQSYMDSKALEFESQDSSEIASLFYGFYKDENGPSISERLASPLPKGDNSDKEVDSPTKSQSHPAAHIVNWQSHTLSALMARAELRWKPKVISLLDQLFRIVYTSVLTHEKHQRKRSETKTPASDSGPRNKIPPKVPESNVEIGGLTRIQYAHFLFLAHRFIHSQRRANQKNPKDLTEVEMLHILEDLVVDFASENSFMGADMNGVSTSETETIASAHNFMLEELKASQLMDSAIQRLAVSGAWYLSLPLEGEGKIKYRDETSLISEKKNKLTLKDEAHGSDKYSNGSSAVVKTLSREHFHNCVFQLVDLWTETTGVDEYVIFLKSLIDSISVPSMEAFLAGHHYHANNRQYAQGLQHEWADLGGYTDHQKGQNFTHFLDLPVLDRVYNSKDSIRVLRPLTSNEGNALAASLKEDKKRRQNLNFLLNQNQRKLSEAEQRSKAAALLRLRLKAQQKEAAQAEAINARIQKRNDMTLDRSKSPLRSTSRYLHQGGSLAAAEALADPVFKGGTLRTTRLNRVVEAPILDHTFWFTNPWDSEVTTLDPYGRSITDQPEESLGKNGLPLPVSVFTQTDPRVLKWTLELPQRYKHAMEGNYARALPDDPNKKGIAVSNFERSSSLLDKKTLEWLRFSFTRQSRQRKLHHAKSFIGTLKEDAHDNDTSGEYKLSLLTKKVIAHEEIDLVKDTNSYEKNQGDISAKVDIEVKKAIERVASQKIGTGLYVVDGMSDSKVANDQIQDDESHAVYRNAWCMRGMLFGIPKKWFDKKVASICASSKDVCELSELIQRETMKMLYNSRIYAQDSEVSHCPDVSNETDGLATNESHNADQEDESKDLLKSGTSVVEASSNALQLPLRELTSNLANISISQLDISNDEIMERLNDVLNSPKSGKGKPKSIGSPKFAPSPKSSGGTLGEESTSQQFSSKTGIMYLKESLKDCVNTAWSKEEELASHEIDANCTENQYFKPLKPTLENNPVHARRMRQQNLIKIQAKLPSDLERNQARSFSDDSYSSGCSGQISSIKRDKKARSKEQFDKTCLHGVLVRGVLPHWRPSNSQNRCDHSGKNQDTSDANDWSALNVVSSCLCKENQTSIRESVTNVAPETTFELNEAPFKTQRLFEAAAEYLSSGSSCQMDILPSLVAKTLNAKLSNESSFSDEAFVSIPKEIGLYDKIEDNDSTGFNQMKQAAVRSIRRRHRKWLGNYLLSTVTNTDSDLELSKGEGSKSAYSDSNEPLSTHSSPANLQGILKLADMPLPRFDPNRLSTESSTLEKDHDSSILNKATLDVVHAKQRTRPLSALTYRTRVLPREVAHRLGRHFNGTSFESSFHRDATLRSGELCWPVARDAAITAHTVLGPCRDSDVSEKQHSMLDNLSKSPYFGLPSSLAHITTNKKVLSTIPKPRPISAYAAPQGKSVYKKSTRPVSAKISEQR